MKLKVLLNEAWDKEGAQGVTAVTPVEQQRRALPLCRDHRGEKGPLGTSWGADPWKESWISSV